MEKRITGFPVVDDDWNLVEFFHLYVLLACFLIFPLPTYCGSELPKSGDLLMEGTGKRVLFVVSVDEDLANIINIIFYFVF